MMRRGFTLIELLVVISIIALLSSVVLASLNAARDKAREAKVRADVNQIYKAFFAAAADSGESYLDKSNTSGQAGSGTDNARWYVADCTTAAATAVDDRPNGEYVRQWATAISAYMPTIPLDPWGNPYWIDAIYCEVADGACGSSYGAGQNRWYYAIGSGGPNGSAPNTYDSDNVVVKICKHP